MTENASLPPSIARSLEERKKPIVLTPKEQAIYDEVLPFYNMGGAEQDDITNYFGFALDAAPESPNADAIKRLAERTDALGITDGRHASQRILAKLGRKEGGRKSRKSKKTRKTRKTRKYSRRR
jgi:hypothetical protein